MVESETAFMPQLRVLVVDDDEPTLQVLAAMRGRSYVNADDLETLLPPVLTHRVELAPGSADFTKILRDCMRAPMETLARSTLSPTA